MSLEVAVTATLILCRSSETIRVYTADAQLRGAVRLPDRNLWALNATRERILHACPIARPDAADGRLLLMGLCARSVDAALAGPPEPSDEVIDDVGDMRDLDRLVWSRDEQTVWLVRGPLARRRIETRTLRAGREPVEPIHGDWPSESPTGDLAFVRSTKASAQSPTELWVWPSGGLEPERYWGTAETINRTSWSPDGGALAVWGAKGAGVLHVVERASRAAGSFARAGAGYAWSPDGRALVVERRNLDRPEDGPFEWLALVDLEASAIDDWLVPEPRCRYFGPTWTSIGLFVRKQCPRENHDISLLLFSVD